MTDEQFEKLIKVIDCWGGGIVDGIHKQTKMLIASSLAANELPKGSDSVSAFQQIKINFEELEGEI